MDNFIECSRIRNMHLYATLHLPGTIPRFLLHVRYLFDDYDSLISRFKSTCEAMMGKV